MRVFLCRLLLLVIALSAGPVPIAWAQVPDPPIPLTAASTDCSTASSCVVLSGPSNGVLIALSPTNGTFQAEFEITGNGGRLWSPLTLFPTNSSTGAAFGAAAGQWRGAAGGSVRVRLSTCTSCSVLVTMTPLSAPPTSGGGGSGGGALTNDPDDASIAVGQTNDNVNAFTNVYDGSVWRRLTIGTAGTASAQVLTVQGIASGTNLNVTCSNCSGTGVSVNEDVASADAQPGTPAYTVRNNTLTGGTNADGDYQPMKATAAGAVYTAPTYADVVASTGVGASGAQTQRVVTATDSTIGTVTAVTTVSTVTNLATIGTSVTPGVAAGNLGKAEDAVAGSADTGVAVFGVRADAAAPTAANGDYVPLLTDALGKLWTTGSFAEDVAHTTADTGSFVLAVRRDADTSLVDATGDYAPLQVNAGGQLKIACIAGCSGSTFVDNAAFTFGTTVIVPIGGVLDDTGTNAATENSAAVARITAQKALHVNLRSAAGVELTPSVDVVEDVGETAGGSGPMVMSVRRDTQASSAGTTGDNATVNTDALGNLWVTGTVIEDAAETAGGQLSMAGSVRRDVAATSAGTTADNATINTDAIGLLWTRTLDPCNGVAKTHIPISIATATTTELTAALAGASTNYYVCSINLVTALANNVALADDDTDNCTSVTSGLAGGTTAATGWNFAANGGLVMGNGEGTIFKTVGTNRVLCLVTSVATQLSGSITVVAAP